MTETHVHHYEPKVIKTLVHKYDNKRKIKGASTATDVLKQLACECGDTTTYDLVRVK